MAHGLLTLIGRMHLLVVLCLAVHGALHGLGLLRWWRLASLPGLGSPTIVSLSSLGERLFGAAWGVAAVSFLVAAALRAARSDAGWTIAALAALLSQALIVVAWRDARAGTLVNVLVLLVSLIGLGHHRFVDGVRADARALLATGMRASRPDAAALGERVRALPAPVQAWLAASHVLDRPGGVATIRLRQRGELRTGPQGAWMQASADQYVSVEPPAFLWHVETSWKGVAPISGRDSYGGGRGRMRIALGSLLNLVDAADDRIALGSMLRYLGETIWFPSAALAPSIAWEGIDERRARATLRDHGASVSGTFTFDPRGRVVRFDAQRYLGGGPEAKLTPWFATCVAWRRFEGVEVPTRGEVGWTLPEGPFVYYRWEILDVGFDPPGLYEGR